MMIIEHRNQWWLRRSYVALAQVQNNPHSQFAVLFVDMKECSAATHWICNGKYKNRKAQTKVVALNAVGYFFDFYLAHGSPVLRSLNDLSILATNFYETRIAGTVIDLKHGIDKLGLYWSPISIRSANAEIGYVESFIYYCLKDINIIDFGEYEQKMLSKTLDGKTKYYINKRLSSIEKYNFFSHANKQKNQLKMDRRNAFYARNPESIKLVVKRPDVKNSNSAIKAFPQSKVLDLIFEGCRISEDKKLPYDQQYNVRDQFLFCLYFFGGLRGGEPLHLWTRDIILKNGAINVILWHPEYAKADWGGGICERKEYILKLCGKSSRNLRGKDETYVGWKNLALNGNNAGKAFCQITWCAPDAVMRFVYKIAQLYILNVRTKCMRNLGYEHPFLFVSKEGRELTDRAARNQWLAAARRIGMTGKRDHGENRHGARHLYAKTLKSLGLDSKILQIALHHHSPMSQLIYTRSNFEEATREIQLAFARIEVGDISEKYIRAIDVRSKLDPLGLFHKDMIGL